MMPFYKQVRCVDRSACAAGCLDRDRCDSAAICMQAPYAGAEASAQPHRDTQVTVTDPVLQRGSGGGQVRTTWVIVQTSCFHPDDDGRGQATSDSAQLESP